jgi:hypothetical protein
MAEIECMLAVESERKYINISTLIILMVSYSLFCRGPLFSSLASYLGGLRFKSRPGDRQRSWGFFVVFLRPSMQICFTTLNYATTTSSLSFQIHSLIIQSFDSTVWVTVSIVKYIINKYINSISPVLFISVLSAYEEM